MQSGQKTWTRSQRQSRDGNPRPLSPLGSGTDLVSAKYLMSNEVKWYSLQCTVPLTDEHISDFQVIDIS